MDTPSRQLLAPADRIGRAKRIDSAQERYIEYAKRTLPRNIRLNGLRVVIDCANGAGYKVAPEALWELGAEVIKIGVEPNGLNINLQVRLDLAGSARAPRCAKCAPTSASRSTAMPTAW